MTLMPKRILVTGGAGFIGSAVAREIVHATPHEVVVLDKLTYAGYLDNLAPVARDSRFRFVRGDIIDTSKMREVVRSFRPDVIMHLAAESHVDRSMMGRRSSSRPTSSARFRCFRQRSSIGAH